jgi:hypothetical protein
MTSYQRFHYSLTRAYGRGILTGQQLAELISIYRGLK